MHTDVDVTKLPNLNALPGLLSDRAYQALRSAIMSMDFRPGEIIRKAPICEQMGISRSPVTEAIQKLSSEGLVNVIPQSATRVTKLSMTEIREGSFLREALEVGGVARAAEMRTDLQISQLQRNLRMQELVLEDGDLSEFFKYDEEFHQIIMACSGITKLPATVATVSLQVNRARPLLLPEPGRTLDTVEEHKRILEAIRVQDPASAEAAMKRHLRELLKRLEPLEKTKPELFTA